ncbi:MAG: putative Short-chain dehydrogenase/reductase [Bradyrhizobium sp.]|jgi:short-subunit dehydrogenase|nr:putative Short-chain dehydrogenase/reductase [Bradyrhizobium sp.]
MPLSETFAVVTGASTGIGLELARCCIREGFDVLIAADELEIERAADELRAEGGGGKIESVRADLSTTEGVDKLYNATNGRPVDLLMANAGRGLGRAFLDQEFDRVRKVIDTNITGTVYLIHKVGNDMRRRNSGRILITGSIAGFMPGSFQAVYNGSKAFLDSFSFALREELRDTELTVTCLMPGATETEFFKRADMMDTKVGTEEKDDAAEVARAGFDAMMRGEGDIVTGMKNKIQSSVANVTPAGVLAKQHRKMAEPGTAKS